MSLGQKLISYKANIINIFAILTSGFKIKSCFAKLFPGILDLKIKQQAFSRQRE